MYKCWNRNTFLKRKEYNFMFISTNQNFLSHWFLEQFTDFTKKENVNFQIEIEDSELIIKIWV